MQYLALLLIPFVLVGGLFYWVGVGLEWLVDWWRDRRQRRIARIEAELDRQQAELRATILHLANELGADAHEARKALIRESFLASGKVPPPE
jgi:enoyl reductase-like protein